MEASMGVSLALHQEYPGASANVPFFAVLDSDITISSVG